ncbi:biopolymer transporter ExbB [Mangrovicoccus algicola]|uniref:Biopolymer transporter ExbB n=1 Tax=Mangrovicoccus algicola TaxID=2771008 RepID=A0A8J7CVK2_9RHOB|nr:biopolymer transporter ExbB [Mangrovicoccus algicola]MBE3636582.1 biopolymer transporter ExbB [Mangrovicoccus algicola]
MVMSEQSASPQFSQPVRQIFMMVTVSAAFAAGGWLLLPRVWGVFSANPYLNGAIGVVFVIGVLACFWQVGQLVASVRWIEGFAAERPGHEAAKPPRLLGSLAALMRSRRGRMQISAASSRTIVDTVATRIDEARDITRYLGNLLIFLGLLGTFYGLATTVPAVVDTIRALAPAEGEDPTAVFARLIGGLETQLGGMGTAFASSLLGLAGSLVVGLLELFASHGQNRFYRELEEWLSTITRLGFAGGEGEGGTDGAAIAAALDQVALQMGELHTVMRESEAHRVAMDSRLAGLGAALDRLGARMEGESRMAETLGRVAEGQERLSRALQVLAEQREAEDEPGAEARMRLRSIDVQLLRLMEDINAGRQESVAELRHDLTRLIRVIETATGADGAR